MGIVEARTISAEKPVPGSGPALAEIRLAAASPPSGLLRRRVRRLWEIAGRRRVTAGSLLVADQALVFEATAELRGRLVIPWRSVRKAVVDDGARWGYVAGMCRFPVYDARADGSGSGVLIGPLWSFGSALMPPGCPVTALDPVPAQAPNVALLIEPPISAPRGGNGAVTHRHASIACLLLCVEDPDAVRAALASRVQVGDVDHEDLAYLGAASGSSSRRRSSRNGAPANGASASA